MMKSKRVLIAGLFHETNTFVEQSTSLSEFHILRGDELRRCSGDSSPLGGALEAAHQFGWTILPTADFRAAPGGTVDDEVIEIFWNEFSRHATPYLETGLDAIYVVLHGAMVSQSIADVEGEVLERMRALANVPIFGVIDLHANFTQRMADHSHGLIAYRENPHTDARQTAVRAAALLERALASGRMPRTYWAQPPVLWPPTGTCTANEPMSALEKLARRIEAEDMDVWAVNVLAGFSFADVPECGPSFSIVSIGAESTARAHLAELAQVAWENRGKGNVVEPLLDEVLPQVLREVREESRRIDAAPDSSTRGQGCPRPDRKGLTVLVEPSDNIGAGAPGDGTCILRALVAHNVQKAAIAINDPEAVRQLWLTAIGDRRTLALGGKGSALDPVPVELNVELVSRSDGRFRLEDKESHLASMAGDWFDMGPCAVVRHEGILILLTSRRTPPFDLGQWRSQGINPEELSLIAVKAAVAHRRAYDPITARSFWVGTPGPCTSNLKALPYRRVRRPVFPLDDP